MLRCVIGLPDSVLKEKPRCSAAYTGFQDGGQRRRNVDLSNSVVGFSEFELSHATRSGGTRIVEKSPEQVCT